MIIAPLEEQIENQAKLIQLLIGLLARIVLVLIVRIQLHVLSDREKASRIDRGIAPLPILALVKRLYARIRRQVVQANRKRPLDLHPVAIAPSEATAALPVKVEPVPVGQQNSSRHGKAYSRNWLDSVRRRSAISLRQVAVPHGQHE